jgi:hypothetical protein
VSRLRREREGRAGERAGVGGGQHPGLHAGVEHAAAAGEGAFGRAARVVGRGALRQAHEQRRLGAREVAGGLAEGGGSGGFEAVDPISEVRPLEPEAEQLGLGQVQVEPEGEVGFEELVEEPAPRAAPEGAGHLHGDRRSAAGDAPVAEGARCRPRNGAGVHPGVAVEPAVFGGDERLHGKRRHVAEPHGRPAAFGGPVE